MEKRLEFWRKFKFQQLVKLQELNIEELKQQQLMRKAERLREKQNEEQQKQNSEKRARGSEESTASSSSTSEAKRAKIVNVKTEAQSDSSDDTNTPPLVIDLTGDDDDEVRDNDKKVAPNEVPSLVPIPIHKLKPLPNLNKPSTSGYAGRVASSLSITGSTYNAQPIQIFPTIIPPVATVAPTTTTSARPYTATPSPRPYTATTSAWPYTTTPSTRPYTATTSAWPYTTTPSTRPYTATTSAWPYMTTPFTRPYTATTPAWPYTDTTSAWPYTATTSAWPYTATTSTWPYTATTSAQSYTATPSTRPYTATTSAQPYTATPSARPYTATPSTRSCTATTSARSSTATTSARSYTPSPAGNNYYSPYLPHYPYPQRYVPENTPTELYSPEVNLGTQDVIDRIHNRYKLFNGLYPSSFAMRMYEMINEYRRSFVGPIPSTPEEESSPEYDSEE